jgi:hypothetical protein
VINSQLHPKQMYTLSKLKKKGYTFFSPKWVPFASTIDAYSSLLQSHSKMLQLLQFNEHKETQHG